MSAKARPQLHFGGRIQGTGNIVGEKEFGSVANARASASLCPCPPESRTPRWPMSESTPPAAAMSAARRARRLPD